MSRWNISNFNTHIRSHVKKGQDISSVGGSTRNSLNNSPVRPSANQTQKFQSARDNVLVEVDEILR